MKFLKKPKEEIDSEEEIFNSKSSIKSLNDSSFNFDYSLNGVSEKFKKEK